MIALTQFLQVVLAGIALVAMAVSVGGVAFTMLVQAVGSARGAQRNELGARVLDRSLHAIAIASIVAAAARIAALLLIPLTFADGRGNVPVAELFSTTYARATIVHAIAALALGTAAWRRQRAIMPIAAALVLVSGAWLTHASSRVADAAALMTLTVAHQLGAAIWIGGVAHLALAWPLVRGDELWPRLLQRFSPIALASVALLFAAGIALAGEYVGSFGALIGTGYGAMVMAKLALLAVALALAYRNFSGVRMWRRGDSGYVTNNVPAYVQAELAIVITALLTAASLTSQAPSADVQTERATPAEVLAFFAPKKPQLVPPPRETYLASANSTADAFAVPAAIERAQNNFNHNIAGLIVLAIGIGAALARTNRVPLARHWPLLFIPLGAFVLLYAEPTVWPLGPEPFWATLAAPGVLQHRLAALLVVGLALGEWRVQAGGLAANRWRYAFPILCAAGGAILLTHSHTVFATKSEFLIELSHAVLGFLALMTGVARWLELRLETQQARAMSALWPACLIAVAVVLVFYREG